MSIHPVMLKRIITSAIIPTDEKSPDAAKRDGACYVGPSDDAGYDYDYDVGNSYGFSTKYKMLDLNVPLFFALRAPNVIILHSK